MKGRQSAHGRFRELIAARLDGPLTRPELRSLSAHLKTCPQCRQVDREYREQRERLHALPSPIPPRDLWARTSSALDREVARGSYRGPGYRRVFGRRRSATPVAALVTSISAVALAGVLVALQFGPSLQRSPSSPIAMPTPFSVSPQSLAFVGSGTQHVSVWRAHVSQVCPTTAPDCLGDDDLQRTEVRLPGNARPRNVALSPSGNQLAVVGREFDEDVISVVTLPSQQSSGAGGEPSEPPDRPTDPTPDRPRTSGDAEPSSRPGSSDDPSGPTNAPPPVESPGVVAILEDVDSTGAPPAWSPNSSEMLAFSAMPADGSHGPDVYVWNVGDSHARAVTDDHSSFFASWSGRRIVISRVVESHKGAASVKTVVIDPETLEERTADIGPVWLPTVNPGRTHAVVWYGDLGLSGGLPDPKSGALYMIDWTEVDPFAEGAPEPPEPTDEPTPSPTPEPTDEPTPDPTNEPTPEPTAEPSDQPTGEPSPRPSKEPSAEPTQDSSVGPGGSPRVAAAPTPEPEGQAGAGAGTAPPTDPATPEPVVEFDPEVVPDGFVAVDGDRDALSDPVIDWQAQWSTDGEVLGIWIADVPGSTWGRLIVRALDRTDSVALLPDAVVDPTLAQRGFTLGVNRVAWVAPTDGDSDGELRIRTWGSDGEGGLRLQPRDGS